MLAEPPGTRQDRLVILILSYLRESQDTISSMLGRRRNLVGAVITWFKECSAKAAADLVDDLSVSRVVRTVIVSYSLKGETLVLQRLVIG